MLTEEGDRSSQQTAEGGQQGPPPATPEPCETLVLILEPFTDQASEASSSRLPDINKRRTPRNSFSQRPSERILLRDLTIDEQHAALPCFMMEDRLENKFFHGRVDVMAQLDTALLPKSPPQDRPNDTMQPKHASISGIGGVGKSEVASRFALTRKANFDAVFWLSADTEEKLDEGDCWEALFLSLIHI